MNRRFKLILAGVLISATIAVRPIDASATTYTDAEVVESYQNNDNIILDETDPNGSMDDSSSDDGEASDGDAVTIEDEQTPLASTSDTTQTSAWIYIVMVAAVATILYAIAFRGRKISFSSEENSDLW